MLETASLCLWLGIEYWSENAIKAIFANLLYLSGFPASWLRESARHCESRRITVKVDEGRQSLEITIADQGIGMSPQQMARVFEKFYRVDTSNTSPSGTGLGLFICKAIVDAHGGSIQIRSNVGQGTKVTVHIPKHRPDET